MSKGTKARNVRVDDELWAEAKEIADERGDNLSEVIRQALRDYITKNKCQTRQKHPARESKA